MKFQTKYYILGTISLIFATAIATFLPCILQHYDIYSENYTYVSLKLLFYLMSAVYYLFCPKFYKQQIINIFCAILFYVAFAIIFHP